jgi:hypothetical protein
LLALPACLPTQPAHLQEALRAEPACACTGAAGVTLGFVDDLRRRMTSSDPTLSPELIIRVLATLGDTVPKDFIEILPDFGDDVESELISILNDDLSWECDPYDERYWLPLHAIMGLGLFATERAGIALADALQIMARNDSELADWFGGFWPALLRNKPDSALRVFERLLDDRQSDDYCRIVSAEVLTAAAQRRGSGALSEMLTIVAKFVADTTETLEFRQLMASMLLNFPRPEHRAVLESCAGLESSIGIMYGLDEVEYAFNKAKDDPDWNRFDDPWQFYSDEAIERRRQTQLEQLQDLSEFKNEFAESFVRESPKIGRNDPCPCGSGRKYKKCCMGS